VKISVYFCTCGTIVSDAIDPGAVAGSIVNRPWSIAGAGDAEVTFKTVEYACSEEGKRFLLEDLQQTAPDRVVVAACSPRDHESTFRGVLQGAGLNPFLLNMVNVREQVAWVTPDKAQAAEKAARLLRAAVARAPFQAPLEVTDLAVCTDVVIVGAGPAGLKAALAAAQAGRKAVLVEHAQSIGGLPVRFEDVFPALECGPCMLEPIMSDVLHGPLAANIELLTLSDVTQVTGSQGNFNVQIRRRPRYVNPAQCVGCGECIAPCPVSTPNPLNCGLGERKAIDFAFTAALPNVPAVDAGLCLRLTGGDCHACVDACPVGEGTIDFGDAAATLERTAGAVVIATGAGQFDAARIPALGYGRTPGVVTSLELERLLASNGPTGGALARPDGAPPMAVAFVHCVGSLDARHCAYCSGVCCRNSFKLGHQVTKKAPGVKIYHVYKQLAVAGKDDARLYDEARKNPHAEFLRYENIDELGLATGAHGGPALRVGERSIPLDFAVLATAVVPGPDTARLAAIFDLPLDEHGFFHELHGRMDAVRTTNKGVFVAGACQAPTDIQGAVTQGMAAVGNVFAALVPGRRLTLEPMTAFVDTARCSGCRTCISVCPYRAITHDAARKVAQVNDALCMGCGTCAAACPAGAMQARHFSDAAILAEIRGLLA
jgi:heterodisulfide reductase subunit A